MHLISAAVWIGNFGSDIKSLQVNWCLLPMMLMENPAPILSGTHHRPGSKMRDRAGFSIRHQKSKASAVVQACCQKCTKTWSPLLHCSGLEETTYEIIRKKLKRSKITWLCKIMQDLSQHNMGPQDRDIGICSWSWQHPVNGKWSSQQIKLWSKFIEFILECCYLATIFLSRSHRDHLST